MIPRTLVPPDSRPLAERGEAEKPRRDWTPLDDRRLVPADLPFTPLDGRSAIPAHVPLEVLGPRVVVPRDVPAGALLVSTAGSAHPGVTVLDRRTVVPRSAAPAALEIKSHQGERLPGVLEPDIFTTGEVHLLVKPVEERPSGWTGQATVSTLLFHAAFIALMLLQPKLFPFRPPTEAEMEMASRQLGFVYLPPQVRDVPRVPPPPNERTSPEIRIDPRILRQLAPSEPVPDNRPGEKGPETSRVVPELPAAPTPQGQRVPEKQEQAQAGSPPLRLEPPRTPEAPPNFNMPRSSPGRALEDSVRGAMRGRGGDTGDFGGPTRPPPGGGGGEGYLGGNMEMLTPTEGVDFTNYLARVLASVKRNWYAVIPESARLGERGRVVLQFRILRDGSVPNTEPVLMLSSGREPLDRAALSSIRASNPFEVLPPAFSGPFIELRFTFLYNIPIGSQ